MSFQIIHDYESEILKIVGNSLYLTLQDDLYNEIDLETTLQFVNIRLNKRLQSGEQLCYFDIDIDSIYYDSSKHEEFVEGFTNRLKQEDKYFKIIKFIDEPRLEIYKNIYSEIAEVEMKIREVFSYIFYSKYDDKNQDIFEEFEVQIVNKEDVKNDILIKRFENKFFYLTFSQYLKFDTPKDIPIKEVLPMIKSNQTYDLLREYLNTRGIVETKHLSFLRNVSKLLEPIENIRNCIAHNRQISNRLFANYPDAKREIINFIDNFWTEEIEEINAPLEINSAELYSYDYLSDLLSRALWDESQGIVFIQDLRIHEAHEFSNINDLNAYLVETANEEAESNFPSNADDREVYESLYNGQSLVNKVLNQYKKELIVMGWI